jgi:serine/threonine-protein kinase
MSDEGLVLELLEKVMESGCTPEAACADHPDLLAEVRERLGRLGRVQDELDALFPEPGPARAEFAPLPRPGIDLPRVPGHGVEAVLGRGGMGVVYKARHVRLNRPVAVKMLLAGVYAGPKELARFRREAEALGGLVHPNIVQVYEAGELDGLPYFTMELVGGGTLDQKLAGVPLPAREAAALVVTLAGAVQAAHEHGIVHRDLKPANVLLTAEGTPKISDFGLARRLEPGAGVTRTGVRVGTPSYMAPEQAAGRAGALGPAVDVYALGAVLYELLTGRPPFRAETAVETERQVLSEDPAPPSRLNARVPRDLETVCLKCLHKDPRRRYGSARELAEDLGRFLDHRPVRARPVGPAERALKWARRRPRTAAVVVSGTLVVGVLIAGGWWLAADRAATTRAVEADLGTVDAALTGSKWSDARTALDRANVRLGDRGPARLRDRLDRAARDLELVARLDDIPMRRATTCVWQFGVGFGLERPDRDYRAVTDFDTAQSDRDYRAAFEEAGLGTVDEPPRTVAGRVRASRVRWAILSALDDWATCAGTADRIWWVLEVARQADDGPESAWQQRVRDPEVWKNPAALTELARAAPPDARLFPLQVSLGLRLVLLKEGDGFVLLRKLQAAHPGAFWPAYWLGQTLAQRGDPDAAGYVRAALAARPGAVVGHLLLGYLLGAEGRLAEAEEQHRRGLALAPANDVIHYNLAHCLYVQGRLEAAADHCREASRLNPRWGPAYVLLGRALLDLGRFAEARDALRRGVELAPAEVKVLADARLTLKRCERLQENERRLGGIVRGTDRPAGAEDAIELAELCYRVRRPATAARLYTQAFADDPKLAELPQNFRYRAACAAVRAACREGENAAALDDPVRAELRRRALAWLLADRDTLAVQYARGSNEHRKHVVWNLRRLLHDADLAGVRDKEGLARLGANERGQWDVLWTSLNGLAFGEAVPILEPARAYASRREWGLAADSYGRILRLYPITNGETWFEHAALQLLAGDLDEYRRSCSSMMAHRPNTPGVRSYHVARACTLAPGAAGDTLKATQLSAGELGRSPAVFWSLTEQAALLHRAGRSPEALPLLERSLAADVRPGTQVVTWLWLSLAHEDLGRRDEARQWLDRAGRWLDQLGDQMPADADARLGLHFHNWLEAHALRREAEGLLRPSPRREVRLTAPGEA